ncbi:MAG: alkaline phosphatase [Treponema sp.]|nr:alkaline phosphatase [Treponema sp.]
MKKCIYKKIAGAVFAAFLISFVAVSCDKPTDTPKEESKAPSATEPEELAPDADGDTIHKMILPSGTGVEINAWEKAADALDKNLPAFVTGFTEDDYKTLSGATNRTAELKAAVKKAIDNNSFAGRTPKNVIIIFGDGMGESHLLGARHYYGDLIMDMLPYHAPVNHDSYPKPGQGTLDKAEKTTDSSAGGTAITTGFKTRYGYIGLDGNGTEVKNLAELAREKGMLVGNVTNDHMGDATPADVSIHAINRDYQNQIYGKLFLSSPDIAMGSDYGYSKYIQEDKTGDARKTIAAIYDEMDKDTKADLAGDDDYSGERLEEACKEASLKLWYESNATDLQKWAIQMLKIYDNKTITGTTYDFNNWAADRNMHSYTTFKKLIPAVQADYSIRAVSNYAYEAKYTYDTSKGQTAKKFGYKLGYGKKNTTLPSYPEMVASTLSILDHKAKAKGDCGFYCLIENTCSDGWGHAQKPYDCLNEVQCFDEGVAIALKYVLENPDTLLIVTADHETGAITYKKGWDTNYKKIVSTDTGHSSEPVPVYAFGAKADLWSDCKPEDTSAWTATDWANYVAGTREGTDYSYQNRQTGIRIGKAMGFEKYGDLNANGVLDPETESDSVISYKLPE